MCRDILPLPHRYKPGLVYQNDESNLGLKRRGWFRLESADYQTKKQDVHSVQSVRPVNRYVKRSVYQGEIDEHSDYEH